MTCMREYGEYTYKKLIEEAVKKGIYRYIVASVVPRNNKVLILERPKSEFMGGIYELPSGKVEKGESLDEALCRETSEETNLTVSRIVNYLGHFDYESKSGEPTRQFNFEVEVKDFSGVRLKEHSNYSWVDKNNLGQYNVSNEVKKILYLFWELDG